MNYFEVSIKKESGNRFELVIRNEREIEALGMVHFKGYYQSENDLIQDLNKRIKDENIPSVLFGTYEYQDFDILCTAIKNYLDGL